MPSRTSRNFTSAPAISGIIPLPGLSELEASQPQQHLPLPHSWQVQQAILSTLSTLSIPMAPLPPLPPLPDEKPIGNAGSATHNTPPLALFARSLVIDERVCCGHPLCISYAILSWPESAYPATDWEEFEMTPVATPEQQSIVLRFTHSHLQLEVRPSRGSFVTIMDVALCLYNARDHCRNKDTLT